MSPAEIEGLLGGTFPGLRPGCADAKRATWRLWPGAGGGLAIEISVEGDWASLQTSAVHARAHAPLDALCAQSAWPGSVKQVAPPPRPMLRPTLCPVLRAEVPLLVNTAAGRAWVARQLRASAAGLRVAAGHEARPEASPPETSAPADPELLAFACTAAGWNAVARPDGAVGIELQVRGAQRALTLQAGDAGIRASVALAAGVVGRASAPCRAAAGAFLMRACAALRWARAFAGGENGRLEVIGFECFVAAPPDEPALLLAVDTLVASCELFACEAEVLLEYPDIAARYAECVPWLDRDADGDSPSSAAAAPRAAAASHAARAALA